MHRTVTVLAVTPNTATAESPFATLTRLARAVTSTLDLAEALDRVAHAATDLLVDSAAAIWVVENHWLKLRADAGYRGSRPSEQKAVLAFGEGLSGHVALTRECLVVADVFADPRTVNIEWLRSEGCLSAVVVPLLLREQLVGVLTLFARHRHRFTPDELEILTAFGTQAAIAIQNAQLFTETDRRRRTAEAVGEVGRLVSRSLDLEEVGQRIADSIRSLLGARASALYRLDPASGDAVAVTISGDAGATFAQPIVFPRGTGVTGLAVRERRPVVTANLLTDPRVTLTPNIRASLEPAPYRAVLAVPLTVQDRVIGALGVGDRAGRIFDQEDIRLAELFADQAAIALENARLFAEQARLLRTVSHREARIEALLDVSRELARIQPLDSLLTTIAATCGQLLGADSVGIRLVEGDELVVGGTWGDARAVMQAPRLKLGESVSGTVARTGEPLVVSDPGDDPRLIPAHREAMSRLGYTALLVVPIRLGEWVMGVLSVHTRRAGRFSPEDLAIVTAFAAQVAVAIENSRLYAEKERAYQDLAQTQTQLVQAQKIQAVGQLAGGIAHDFNNLITVIAGRTDLLLRRLRAEDPLRRDIDVISQTADRAANLTRQLLAFSRKQVLEPRVVDLNAVVTDLTPMLQRLIGENIALVTALDPGLGHVTADARQFEQVIMNLAINARDAMPNGGQLTLETANIDLDATYARQHPGVSPGPHVMLAVSDTGVGMDAETQARLFEPFFTTKGPGKGTGLGLSTVYGIVKQSGGNIWVYSEVGRGTTFKIYLPRVDRPVDHAGPVTPVKGPSQGSETILLVEDETAVRELARDVLAAQGYTVLEAAHGPEAILISERHTGLIHLLLTDVVMPQMSGRVLAERLRSTRPEMQVLYMSGYTENAVVRHGVLDPGTAFLQKPFTPAGLAAAVREVLDQTVSPPALPAKRQDGPSRAG